MMGRYKHNERVTVHIEQEHAHYVLHELMTTMADMIWTLQGKPFDKWSDDRLEKLGILAKTMGNYAMALGMTRLHLEHEPQRPLFQADKAVEKMTDYLGTQEHRDALGLHIPDVKDTELAGFLLGLLGTCLPLEEDRATDGARKGVDRA